MTNLDEYEGYKLKSSSKEDKVGGTTIEVSSVEIVMRMTDGSRLLELQKTDDDTWIMVLSDKRPDGKELPREAMILTGAELRCICENKFLFGK